MERLDGRELAAIFAGGMVGAVLRVWMSRQFSSTAPHWPWATFIVNVSGSVVLAYFATRLQERRPLSTSTTAARHRTLRTRRSG
jgi:fluoride exporter